MLILNARSVYAATLASEVVAWLGDVGPGTAGQVTTLSSLMFEERSAASTAVLEGAERSEVLVVVT
jgi:hypothetical protein